MTQKIKCLTAVELIQNIEQAFTLVKKSEKTLEQCFITDEYGMGGLPLPEFKKIFHEASKVRPYDHWTDISYELIQKHDSPFANMSNEEYAFYLPAYMRYVVKKHLNNNHENWWDCTVLISVARSLGYKHDYEDFQYMYSAMNNKQKRVVLEYVMFVVDLSYKTIKDNDFFDNIVKKSRHEYHLETILRAKNTIWYHFAYLLDV